MSSVSRVLVSDFDGGNLYALAVGYIMTKNYGGFALLLDGLGLFVKTYQIHDSRSQRSIEIVEWRFQTLVPLSDFL